MSDSEICKTYSDAALRGIVRQLLISGEWPSRLSAVKAELARRKAGVKR